MYLLGCVCMCVYLRMCVCWRMYVCVPICVHAVHGGWRWTWEDYAAIECDKQAGNRGRGGGAGTLFVLIPVHASYFAKTATQWAIVTAPE